MDIFHEIANRIVKEQGKIIGTLAWREAKRIPGVTDVNEVIKEITLDENKQEAINNIVGHYNNLFGRASYEITKASVVDLLQKLSVDEVPSSLRSEDVAIEKVTQDLYKRTVELASKNEMLLRLRKDLEKSNKYLQRANQKLQELDQAKDDFINIASHQLKSPVFILKNSLELFQKGSSKSTEDKAELLSDSFKQISRLEKLISEILLASRLSVKKYSASNPDRVNISQCVRQVVEDEREFAEKRGVRLELKETGDSLVRGEELYLKEALSNLIHNAIKYSKEPEKNPFVSVNIDKDEENVIITVRDNGIGISKMDIPKLFTKFARGSNASSSQGTGLGLFIAKAIIEGHGGKVWAESKGLGMGSSFCVVVPYDKTNVPKPYFE